MEQVFNAKLDGLRDLINEKFAENKASHTELQENQKLTNGRVRMIERVLWGLGGAVAVLATLYGASSLPALAKIITSL